MNSIKNVFAQNRRSVEVFTTLLVIALLVFYYYSIYVPQKEHAIVEQRFRMMKHIDNSAKEKLHGYESMMRNYLSICTDPELHFDSVKNYLTGKSSNHFSLQITKQPKAPSDLFQRSELMVNNGNREGTMLLIMDTIAGCNTAGSSSDSCKYTLTAEVVIADFANPLLKKDVFNEYIILNDSQIIYQTFPSGLSYRYRDSLMRSKGGITTSTNRDLTIGGTNYKLFLQPVEFLNYKDWIIIGLLKSQTLNAEKHRLPGNIIEWLIIGVLLFCFLLPWFKMMLMGKSERIKLEDVAFTYICSMLLVSFIFFLGFKYNLPFRPTAKTESGTAHSDSKIFIANKIVANFQQEIEQVYNQLKTVDSLRAANNQLLTAKSLKNIKTLPTAGTQFEKDASLNTSAVFSASNAALTLQKSIVYPYFLNTYWLDATGNEIANWSANDTNPPPSGNFKRRAYFQNIIHKNTYSIHNKPNAHYFIEPIYSWIDQDFKVVLSIPSAVAGQVAVITFKPQSVFKPVMLYGYAYAIVNNLGDVLFHSNPDKNLNENILDELSAANSVSTSLQTHVAKSFGTNYSGKKYSAYLAPLSTLPYSIVVFSDLLFKERRNLECFSFSLMMFFTFFMVLCIEIVLVLCASYRKTRLRKNKFKLYWIYPQESRRSSYTLMLCVYCCTLIYLTAYIFLSPDLSLTLFIFIFLGTGVLLSIISSIIYSKLDSLTNIKISKHYVSHFAKVRRLATWALIKQNIANNASVWLLGLWIIINISAWHYLRIEYLKCLISELIILIISVLLILKREWLTKKSRSYNYSHLFTSMIFVRLLITCGLPMVIFYINGYNYDQHITTRMRLLDFAQQVKHKSDTDPHFINTDKNNFNTSLSYYYDQSWVKGMELVDTVLPVKNYKREENANLTMIHSARISYNQLSKRGDNLSWMNSHDLTWHFNSVFANADTCWLKWNTNLPPGVKQKYLKVYGDSGLNYQFPVLFHVTEPKEIIFWLLLFAILILFYFMLHFMVLRLYGLFETNTRGLNEMYRDILMDNNLNNLVYINGAPGSDKMVLVKRHLEKIGLTYNKAKPDTGPVLIIDMLAIPDPSEKSSGMFEWQALVEKAFDKKYEMIIFNHFEYNINNHDTNRLKLNMIERFMLDGKKKLVIVSAIHQATFLEVLEQWTSKSDAEMQGIKEDIPRWNALLGHFLNLYVSLNREIEELWGERADWKTSMVIWEECRHTNFLRRLHTKMQSYVAYRLAKDPSSISREDIILKVQSLAHLFYLYTWNSLTREEQFLLYDLAEDGLINTTNKHLVRRLMNKGMIHLKNGRLTLFNKSFRNFILTSISTNDAKIIEAQIKDNGTWKTLRYPALLILASISYFIFTAEQENLGEVVKYLSALAAGIPLIVKMLSITVPSESK